MERSPVLWGCVREEEGSTMGWLAQCQPGALGLTWARHSTGRPGQCLHPQQMAQTLAKKESEGSPEAGRECLVPWRTGQVSGLELCRGSGGCGKHLHCCGWLPGSLGGSGVGLDLNFTEIRSDSAHGSKQTSKQQNKNKEPTEVEWCSSECDHQVAAFQLLF